MHYQRCIALRFLTLARLDLGGWWRRDAGPDVEPVEDECDRTDSGGLADEFERVTVRLAHPDLERAVVLSGRGLDMPGFPAGQRFFAQVSGVHRIAEIADDAGRWFHRPLASVLAAVVLAPDRDLLIDERAAAGAGRELDAAG